jgi:predicted HAD superfamily Cof-like phosphohydrolase
MPLGNQARTFREVFNQAIESNISSFGVINQDLWNMQIALIEEESAEFIEAAAECFADPENPDRRYDLTKELSDLVFVCYQFAAAFGIDLDRAMTLVFNSNMSKLDEHGMPIYREDGKVLKGPNYEPPDLSSCVPAPLLSNVYYDTNGK